MQLPFNLCPGPASCSPDMGPSRGTGPSFLSQVSLPRGQSWCLLVEVEGTYPYQVWRAGLGLGSVIVQVQIDQDFSCSPYSAGHSPYCELSKSRGRGDREKGSPLAPRKLPTGRMWGRAHVPMQTAPNSFGKANQPRGSTAQVLWRWGRKEEHRTPWPPQYLHGRSLGRQECSD